MDENLTTDRILLVSLPLSTLFIGLALFVLNPAWIYSHVGTVDSWGYVGMFVDPVGLRNAFPKHPAGDLLPLILPTAVLYNVLSPFYANLIFKLITFTACGSLFFFWVRNDFGTQTAMVSLIYLLFYQYFLIAVGGDYTDGRVILYYMAILFFISQSSLSQRHSALYMFLAGAFLAFSVSTALLSVVYVPVICIYILGKRYLSDKKLIDIGLAIAFFIGFGLTIVTMCLVHYSYAGSYIYFWNTLEKAANFLNANRIHNQLRFGVFVWGVVLPFSAIATGIVYGIRRLLKGGDEPVNGMIVLAWVMNFTTLAILYYLELVRHQETVSNWSYLSQSIPVFFLGLASIIKLFIDEMPPSHLSILLIILLLTNTLAFYLFLYGKLFTVIMILCVAMGSAVFLLRNAAVLKLTVISILYVLINYHMGQGYILHPGLALTPIVTSRLMALEATVKWLELIKVIDPNRKAFLWYDANSKYIGHLFRQFSSASHLWQGRILNESFPQLDVPIGEVGVVDTNHLVDNHIPILVLTRENGLIDTSRTLFLARGILLVENSRWAFSFKDLCFEVIECHVIRIHDKHGSNDSLIN